VGWSVYTLDVHSSSVVGQWAGQSTLLMSTRPCTADLHRLLTAADDSQSVIVNVQTAIFTETLTVDSVVECS